LFLLNLSINLISDRFRLSLVISVFSICLFILFQTEFLHRQSLGSSQKTALFNFPLISTMANHWIHLNLLIYLGFDWIRPSQIICLFQFAYSSYFRLISTIANHLFLLNLLILSISDWFRPWLIIFSFHFAYSSYFTLISTIINHFFLSICLIFLFPTDIDHH
jgi:hypothetical protein